MCEMSFWPICSRLLATPAQTSGTQKGFKCIYKDTIAFTVKAKDPFYLKKYKEERRNTKRTLRSIRNKYIIDVICKPLESGNSKPFYRHFKHVQNSSQPELTLKKEDQSNTSDPRECADILNNFFFNQFCQEGALDEQPVNLTSNSDF